jgi:hypothetical protein
MEEAELPIGLPVITVCCAGNTSGTVPVPFDGEPVAAPLSGVQSNLPLLGENEESFVRRITERASPAPENHERIAGLNGAGVQPEGDPTELEAGANRCAAG